MKIAILLIYFLNFLPGSKAQFGFNIEFVEAPSEKTIHLKATFRNKSTKPMQVLKSRSVDYIRGGILPIGNYIIETQLYQDNAFKLFTPSADIDPVYEEPEFITVQGGQSISDTLKINGYLFSGNIKPGSGFPSGRYRIRVAFNANGYRDKKLEFKKWLEFTIP